MYRRVYRKRRGSEYGAVDADFTVKTGNSHV